jgi:hypothetical protein
LGTVFIDNVGGANGSLGGASVARATPDGYTLLLGGSAIHTNEALLKSRPLFNPAKDLEPIMCLAVGSAYDLRRLRLHGLITRIPKTRRYRLTTKGLRTAIFYTRLYSRSR